MEEPRTLTADVDSASWVNNHLYELIQPQYLRAPEVILGAKWDTGADIWNTACVVRTPANSSVVDIQ